MYIKKIFAVVLVVAMVLSMGATVSAADHTLYANYNLSSEHNLIKNSSVGMYFENQEQVYAVTVECPSYSNNIGTLHFGLYMWQGDFKSTLEGDELRGMDFVDFKDNAGLLFEFPTLPEGEWYVHITAVGTDLVGIWSEGYKTTAADDFKVKLFENGKELANRTPRGKIHTGASATLGKLNLSGEEIDPIDIGTETTSKLPAKTFEEKIAESIVMYTGSPTAYVGAKTTLIDKFNKNVTPVVVNDRTLLPIRFISENLGTSLDWDDVNQIIKMERYGTTIEMRIGNDYMKINDEPVALDVAPVIMNGRTMVPLRAVVHALNIPIHWRQDGSQGLIIIGETCNDIGEDLPVVAALLRKLKMK